MIYRPLSFPNVDELIAEWNHLAKSNGLDGIHFIGYSLHVDQEYDKIKSLGFDAINSCRLGYGNQTTLMRYLYRLTGILFNIPRIFSYKSVLKQLVGDEERRDDVYPTLIPNWDHTPRSGRRGYVYHNSTPTLFKRHAEQVLRLVMHKKDKTIFLKSWNEWGEGNYMEPDLKYGKGYINALKDAITEVF